MKAYVINLDRRPDRLERFRELADRLGFDFERIPAVDGNAPELRERAAGLRPGWSGPRVGPYVLACFESHREAWRRLLDSGEPHALILEDDLVLAEDFGDLVNETVPGGSWLPPDCDILRLETWNILTHIDRRPHGRVHGRGIHRLRGGMLGTAACIVTARAARFLLRETQDIRDPVDQVLFNRASPLFPRLVTYQMVPAPAIQGHLAPPEATGRWAQSTLHEARAQDGALPVRPRGVRASGMWRKAMLVKSRLKGLAMGTRYMDVPFG
ncbi:MAG: hypothetical protein CVT80_09975 [Alphaproteobacteria bacterium HGW-Alphaproteobacteria-2]|nr:MAG: hypothetical protein CVT80_09975 [Alphaproteobacteria bacterium HGW-Alphaproteobacteria-2]